MSARDVYAALERADAVRRVAQTKRLLQAAAWEHYRACIALERLEGSSHG